jgi:hypothetical protein
MTIFLLILLALVLGLVILALGKPNTFRIERSAEYTAAPEALYARIADFRQWEDWSPWAKLDPACKNTYSGSPSGLGAVFAWDGNKKVGVGRMEITACDPPQRVVIRLDFLRPFATTNTCEFRVESTGSGSRLTWAMSGENKFVSKLFCVFMDMDKMVGRDFEKGLASLRELVE